MPKFQKSVIGRNMAHQSTDDDAVCEEVVDKLMHIITWAFNDGFSFSTNHIDTDIAVNICLVLRVGGSPDRAATRIAALMRALLGSGKSLRAQYSHDRMGNAMFYEAVAQDLFVGARKSFIRECPDDNEEGIYTEKTERLLGLVDSYLDYADGYEINKRNVLGGHTTNTLA
ncbi:hypothetical protein CkaCkLH20_05275 [Colletotrichum karsti]|uniref:Uncharacterized protein n=1 Tax=Colletotrichum karsti TaxID=1095194 RepID=A0A9P6I691_9PEZI|nr:uncharacterized protein CkaCkLH20_05275 [Colletotrichum karsti]KAF9877009.1 hypothetical protein CkaCkLH20_05275 [Colletotrichum karsti]